MMHTAFVPRRLAVLLAVALLAVPLAASAEPWTLMYPPLTSGTTSPNLAAPLPEWTAWLGFSSQTVCEEQKALWHMVIKAETDEAIRAAGRRAVFAQGIPPPSADIDKLEDVARRWVRDTGTKLRSNQGTANQILVAQCVSIGDPRLAPKPAR
jgi:hypothetical protein